MNYASISEIYDQPVLQQRQNSYDYIIKNLVQTQKSEPSRNIPVPTGDSKYSTYKRVENFDNTVEDKVLKDIETKIDTDYNKPEKKKYISIPEEPEHFSNSEDECMRFLAHISKCEKCREFVMKKFGVAPKNQDQKNREEMLDIAIYILTGVFVLFLLDSFMSLGRFIKK